MQLICSKLLPIENTANRLGKEYEKVEIKEMNETIQSFTILDDLHSNTLPE